MIPCFFYKINNLSQMPNY